MKSIHTISLVNPLGAGADREDIGTSTVIESERVRIEAPFTNGCIGDASVYKKDDKGEWVWKVGVPASNIKSYKLSEPPTRGESQAPTQATGRKA